MAGFLFESYIKSCHNGINVCNEKYFRDHGHRGFELNYNVFLDGLYLVLRAGGTLTEEEPVVEHSVLMKFCSK